MHQNLPLFDEKCKACIANHNISPATVTGRVGAMSFTLKAAIAAGQQ
jgi:hypothetical protein